jgi:hypothetical protein
LIDRGSPSATPRSLRRSDATDDYAQCHAQHGDLAGGESPSTTELIPDP